MVAGCPAPPVSPEQDNRWPVPAAEDTGVRKDVVEAAWAVGGRLGRRRPRPVGEAGGSVAGGCSTRALLAAGESLSDGGG